MKYLKEVMSTNGEIHGYCETEKEISDLLSNLKARGFDYSIRRSAYYRHSPSSTSKHEAGLYFSHVKGSVPIKFFGPAFSVKSLIKRECSLGPMYRNKIEGGNADHLVDHVNTAKKEVDNGHEEEELSSNLRCQMCEDIP